MKTIKKLQKQYHNTMKKLTLSIISILLIGATLIGCDDANLNEILNRYTLKWEKTEIEDATELYDITHGNNLTIAIGKHTSNNILILTKTNNINDAWQKTILPTRIETPLGTFQIGQPRTIKYLNNQFIAVGANGTILTSSDPTSDDIGWTAQTSGTPHWLLNVTYGNGLYVAVGRSGTLLTSPNGTTWTNRTSGTTDNLYGVTYGNGLYVAVGWSGTLLTSPNGTTWTNRTSGTTTLLRNVTYGNGLYVAVGSGRGTILTSTNGTTWKKNNIPIGTKIKEGNANITININNRNITYINNKFIMTGVGEAHVTGFQNEKMTIGGSIETSTDGTTWSTGKIIQNNKYISPSHITYNNNKYIMIAHENGGKKNIILTGTTE